MRRADDIKMLRSFINDNGGSNLKIISKIENTEGIENFEEIQKHEFFKDFNWDDLISLNMKPAYIPKLESNENTNIKNKLALYIIEIYKKNTIDIIFTYILSKNPVSIKVIILVIPNNHSNTILVHNNSTNINIIRDNPLNLISLL